MATLLPIEFAKKAIDALISAFTRLRRVQVRVHDAVHVAEMQTCYFVNVTNLSNERDVEITHVWFETTPSVPILNPERPLPHRLKPDESWETWIPVGSVETDPQAAFKLARVRLSTGTVLKSKRNKNVPPIGAIPGALPASKD